MLTKEEYSVVAKAAETYPKGYGEQWLSVEDEERDDDESNPLKHSADVAQMIEADSSLIGFGWPAVKLAAVRGNLTSDGLEKAINDICREYGTRNAYISTLDENPKAVAEFFRTHKPLTQIGK